MNGPQCMGCGYPLTLSYICNISSYCDHCREKMRKERQEKERQEKENNDELAR